ncbi:MAG: hypothetical protein K1X72_10540 [Pyrinomonadaceae bacterium]|nr:hypothetical protein [Pyrinomonadaceae bacterium]
MGDWLGLGFFVLLIVAIYFGLKRLGNQPKRTEDEFENRVSDGTGLMSAGVGALNELLNPNEAKAKEVKVQLKEGRFNKKKREGKANGEEE